MITTKQSEPEQLGFLNLLIIVLSIYVLLALLVDTFFKLPTEVSRILNMADNAISFVFLVDFGTRFYRGVGLFGTFTAIWHRGLWGERRRRKRVMKKNSGAVAHVCNYRSAQTIIKKKGIGVSVSEDIHQN